MTAVKKDDVKIDDATKKWMVLAPKLAHLGVDTSKLKGLNIAVVVGQFDADFATTPQAVEEADLKDWVDGLLEEHPSWETPAHKRLRLAEELVENSNPPEYSDPDEPEELAKCQYAVCMESRYSTEWFGCEDLEALAKFYNGYWFDSHGDDEDDPYISSVIDLDTGEYPKINIKECVITVIDDGEKLVEVQHVSGGEITVNHDLVMNWKSDDS
jgi:hypothetical protein